MPSFYINSVRLVPKGSQLIFRRPRETDHVPRRRRFIFADFLSYLFLPLFSSLLPVACPSFIAQHARASYLVDNHGRKRS